MLSIAVVTGRFEPLYRFGRGNLSELHMDCCRYFHLADMIKLGVKFAPSFLD